MSESVSGVDPGRVLASRERVDVVFNPVSGHGDAARERAELESVLSRGYKRVVVHETTRDVGAGARARAALDDGADVLVASGGDGTITAVAGALHERVLERAAGAPESERPAQDHARGDGRQDLVLAAIPRGTGNAFCAALGIPLPVADAAELINNMPTRAIDIAKVNGKEPMILLCAIGLEAEAIMGADREVKARIGPLAYLWSGMLTVAQEKRFTARLALEDVYHNTRVHGVDRVEATAKEVQLKATDACAVTIANVAPAPSMLAQGAGEVVPDDGLLEVVCVTPDAGPLATLRTLARLLRGALTPQFTPVHPSVTGLRARRIRVECDPPQRVIIDGEDGGVTPVVVELSRERAQRQIRVVAPEAGVVSGRRRSLGRALVSMWNNMRIVAGLVAVVGVLWAWRSGPSVAVSRSVGE